MLASQIPAKIPLPFASSGTKNAIPTLSQIGITAGAASLTDGFPPLTFTPLGSGGVPPSGADFNGIFNMITAVQQWQSAGGIFKFDATFATSIGGYPKGSILMSTSNDTTWLNLVDNNTTNPDATDGSAANWAPLGAYGITAVSGLTNANVTLTPAQFGKPIITLSGTLTGNVQIVFPLTLQEWSVINNTTGAFAVTCKTAAGTGAVVAQGASQLFYGDGTNLVPMPADARYAAIGAGLKFGSIVAAPGTTTWTQSTAAGKFIYTTAAGATTQTLPLASTFSPGQAIVFFNNGTGTPTFARQGTDGVLGVMGGGTSFVLNPTEAVILTTDGASWFCNFLNGATGLVRQTQQDMTASRPLGSTFTNSTGRPIFLEIRFSLINAVIASIIVDGVAVQSVGNNTGSTTNFALTAMVLPNSTYSMPANGVTVGVWMEIR